MVTIGLVFVSVRVIGLLHEPEFEDHDSIAYLRYSEVLRSGDVARIVNLTPDAAPVYPTVIVLAAAVTGDLELAARLVSFAASCLVAALVVFLGLWLGAPWGAAAALFLLALNPTLMRLSYSVLSEPIYLGVVLGAFTLYLTRFERPTVRSGALIGAAFAFTFLTRFEGILFLAAIPAMQIAHRSLFGATYSWRKATGFIAAYVLAFVIVAAPQVARVSHVMGKFELSGRPVWSTLLRIPDGRGYSEKIYGLDFDPAVTNIDYLRLNAGALSHLIDDAGPGSITGSYTRLVIENVRELNNEVLGTVVGIPMIALAVVGLVALASRTAPAHIFMFASFVAIGLAGPLLHNVAARHVAVVVPILVLFAGIGTSATARWLAQSARRLLLGPLAWGLLVATLASSVYALDVGRILVRPDDANHAYDKAELESAISIVRARAANSRQEPIVVARMSYLGHYAGAATKIAPYTDLAGLIGFCAANHVDFLYVELRLLTDYPFLAELQTDRAREHFSLVDSQVGRDLYVFHAQPDPVDSMTR
jgi:hypothetical protein